MNMKTLLLTTLILLSSTCFSGTQPKISIHQALRLAEKAGYTNIHKIEYEAGQWEIEGRDQCSKPFLLKIDTATGDISKNE